MTKTTPLEMAKSDIMTVCTQRWRDRSNMMRRLLDIVEGVPSPDEQIQLLAYLLSVAKAYQPPLTLMTRERR